MNVLILGVQRSCTNLVQYILRENFDIVLSPDTIKFKHWTNYFNHDLDYNDYDAIIVCAKNPYAWLVSYAKYRGKAFDYDFIKNEHLIVGIQASTSRSPIQALIHYDICYNHWTKIPGIFLFKHEDYVNNSAINTIIALQKKFNFPTTPQYPCITLAEMNMAGFPTKQSFDSDYYIKKKYLNYYTKEMLDLVNRQLDAELLKKLGYEYEKDLHYS